MSIASAGSLPVEFHMPSRFARRAACVILRQSWPGSHSANRRSVQIRPRIERNFEKEMPTYRSGCSGTCLDPKERASSTSRRISSRVVPFYATKLRQSKQRRQSDRSGSHESMTVNRVPRSAASKRHDSWKVGLADTRTTLARCTLVDAIHSNHSTRFRWLLDRDDA